MTEGSSDSTEDEDGMEREEVDIEEAVIQATQQPEKKDENLLLKQQKELVNYLKVVISICVFKFEDFKKRPGRRVSSLNYRLLTYYADIGFISIR